MGIIASLEISEPERVKIAQSARTEMEGTSKTAPVDKKEEIDADTQALDLILKLAPDHGKSLLGHAYGHKNNKLKNAFFEHGTGSSPAEFKEKYMSGVD